MENNRFFKKLEDLLDSVGIRLNGSNPWDIQINNRRFPSRVLAGGSLALGESYMDGWWDCQAIDQLICRLLNAEVEKKVRRSLTLLQALIKTRILNLQTKTRSFIVGKKHYDLGHDLFRTMLDQRMIYSCGYWKDAKTLDEAQEAKLELIARKLKLEPGMTVLDIGCGWGGLAKFLAEKHGVHVTGITISRDQEQWAIENCEGMDVQIMLRDYREIEDKFDRIVSVGMFEHVGRRNYVDYFKTVNRCLKDGGLHLLHTIGANETDGYGMDPWLDKYIFPNAILPTAARITRAIDHLFKIEDWHNFGEYYDKTLMHWHDNFTSRWNDINANYDTRFYRMWKYYLLSCAGTFRSGVNGLWQVVLSKPHDRLSYESVR